MYYRKDVVLDGTIIQPVETLRMKFARIKNTGLSLVVSEIEGKPAVIENNKLHLPESFLRRFEIEDGDFVRVHYSEKCLIITPDN